MGDPVAWVWGTHFSQLTRSISGEAAAATTRSSGLCRHTAWMSSALGQGRHLAAGAVDAEDAEAPGAAR